jgi:hypothetical protein
VYTEKNYGEPDRVSQMSVLIKTVSNTNSPLFCLSVIYIQKSLKRKKDFFADTEKISGLNSCYFHARVHQIIALIKTVSKTKCPLFYIYSPVGYMYIMNTTVYRLPSFSKKIHQVYYGTRKHCLP